MSKVKVGITYGPPPPGSEHFVWGPIIMPERPRSETPYQQRHCAGWETEGMPSKLGHVHEASLLQVCGAIQEATGADEVRLQLWTLPSGWAM